jgi:hypothetical protein
MCLSHRHTFEGSRRAGPCIACRYPDMGNLAPQDSPPRSRTQEVIGSLAERPAMLPCDAVGSMAGSARATWIEGIRRGRAEPLGGGEVGVDGR